MAFNVPQQQPQMLMGGANAMQRQRVQSAMRSHKPASLFHYKRGRDGRKSITTGTATTSQTKTQYKNAMALQSAQSVSRSGSKISALAYTST